MTQKPKLIKTIILFLFKNNLFSLIILFILPIFHSIFNVYFFSKYMGAIAQSLFEKQNKDALISLLKFMTFVFSIQFMRYVQQKLLGNILIIINGKVKTLSLEKLLTLPVEEGLSNGEKVNKLCTQIVETIQTGFFFVYKPICTVGVSVCVMIFCYNTTLSLIFLGFLIVYFSSFPFILRALIKASSQLEEVRVNNNNFLNDVSRNFFFEKLFRLKNLTLDMFKSRLEKENILSKKKYQSLASGGLLANLIISGTCFVLFAITIFLNIEPKTKIITITLINKFFTEINDVPNKLIPLLNNLGEIKENYSIFNLIEEEQKEEVGYEKIEIIELKNISYTYMDTKKEIFENFSYVFKPGLYVIDGESGRGKSTLIELITGVRTCHKGDVFYNEKNLKKISMLNNISYMTQDSGIYNRTVRDNIFLNKKEGQDSLFFKYMKIMNMEELLDYTSGPQGSCLSGGQIRRISFLRMLNFYKKGNLLILDEPFISLDEQLVILIKDFLKSISREHIIIIADHNHVFTNKEAIYINL